MKKKNILLITSDQQHWNTIGAFNSEIKTPNLDRLVREGTTFQRAYCCNPTCTPTRSSILTGMYPSQHGAWTLGTKLPENSHTFGDDFMKAGYRTALVGKAHFQPLATTDEFPSIEAYPILQDLDYWKTFNDDHDNWYGFDHVELARNHVHEAHVGQHYVLWLEEKGCHNWRDYFVPPTGTKDVSIKHTWAIPEEFHYDKWIAERTNILLDQFKENDEPFFLWSSFFDPHPEYLVPEPWDKMYDPDALTIPEITEGEHANNPPHFLMTQEENPDFSSYKESGFGLHGMHSHLRDKEELKRSIATYYGMISLMDKYIGKILDKLDELGLTEDTLVLFTTDHGHYYGHHGLVAKGPFMYEDSIKIPFIIRQPGTIPANRTTDALHSIVDLAPTFLNLSGLPIPRIMTGIDQSAVWFGEKNTVRDHIICEHHHDPTTVHLKTYVDERYKITVYYNHSYGELYDLEKDPAEIHNLWSDENYKDLKMELLLKYIWAELGKEPMWMPRIADA